MKPSAQKLLTILLVLIVAISTNACDNRKANTVEESHIDTIGNKTEKQEGSILDTIKCKQTFDSILNREVYEYVPEMPEFPGGQEAMYNYLYKNLRYELSGDSIQGSVIVAFIIESDGSISDVYAPRPYFENGLSSLEKGLIEIVKSMPKWKPAKCYSKPVPLRFTLPIKF